MRLFYGEIIRDVRINTRLRVSLNADETIKRDPIYGDAASFYKSMLFFIFHCRFISLFVNGRKK